ncbi:type IV toxin-antitoxin system AbiEi family antitoxin domain-containing protein [Thermophilibacter sp.]
MTKFDDIFEVAADNHGLITSAQARQVGVSNNELVQYARRGRVTRVGHGLYQLSRWVPGKNDPYAWAVASVGPDALLYGESVIAMLGLAPTNPNRIFVATPKRTRRKLPGNLVVEHIDRIEPSAIYDGIPCQSAYDAITSCEGKMLPERLVAAANEARRQGLVSKRECSSLVERLARNDGQATE